MTRLPCFVAAAFLFAAVPAIAQTPTAPDFSGQSWHWFHVRDRDCWVWQPPRPLPMAEQDWTRVCAERITFDGRPHPRSPREIETTCRTKPIDRTAYDYYSFDWSGACKGRLVDGLGVLSRLESDSTHDWTPDGAVQIGSFENGVMNGPGRSKSDSGSYEGTFRNGALHGQGRQDLPGEGHYEGGFYDGHFDGHGLETFPNGDAIEGWFANGRPVGRVVFRSADGNRLEGAIVLPHADAAFPVPPPAYPVIATRLNENGFVVIAFTVTKDGRMKDIRVKYASGSQRLDNAALTYVSKLHMLPGSIAGRPVEMPAEQGVAFDLISPIVNTP